MSEELNGVLVMMPVFCSGLDGGANSGSCCVLVLSSGCLGAIIVFPSACVSAPDLVGFVFAFFCLAVSFVCFFVGFFLAIGRRWFGCRC